MYQRIKDFMGKDFMYTLVDTGSKILVVKNTPIESVQELTHAEVEFKAFASFSTWDEGERYCTNSTESKSIEEENPPQYIKVDTDQGTVIVHVKGPMANLASDINCKVSMVHEEEFKSFVDKRNETK